MKTACVVDMRKHFCFFSAWIENGEEVTILRKGDSFSLLTAVKPKKALSIDGASQAESIREGRIFNL